MKPVVNQVADRRQVMIGIAIIGVVFFIIGFVSWVNSILIPYFRIACELTNYQSYFVTFSFYIAYLVMSVPVAYLLKRTGYKKGMMYGFFCLAAGALLFVPAALNRAYWIFLAGLFTMGTGLIRISPLSDRSRVRHGGSVSWEFVISLPALSLR